MEMKQRVQHLIADVERACIKYKLNMTIYDGKLANVGPAVQTQRGA